MKNLLAAIKAQLQTDLTYVRDSDIFVTVDPDAVPKAVRYPAVGLKDGAVVRKELAGGMMEYTLNIMIIVWVKLLKDEAAVMGDDATGKKGVLEIADDIHASLDENLLDITGMQDAVSAPTEEGSELFGDEKEALQRKVINYQYVKEELRP